MDFEKGYTEFIRVPKSSKEKLRNECRELFLKYHPEFRGFRISDGFMFKKVIDFYIETEQGD